MNCIGLLKKIRSDTVVTSLSVSLLLSFTLCFFGPATLYFTNFYEYYYTFSDIFPSILIMTTIVGGFLTLILLLLPQRYHQQIVCLVFALGVSFYIQGNVIVWDYGPLNGHEIMWDQYLFNGIIDSLIWIIIFVFCFFKYEKIYKYVSLICLFLLFIQIGGLLSLIYFSPPEPQWKTYTFFEDGSKFEFSSDKNVIIIIVDTFQSDIFQEIINENDDYKKMFEGFTYYRNAVGGYPTTIASVPLILTGEHYNNSIPFDEFVKSSYESSSLPRTLKNNGFIVDIYGNNRIIYPSEQIISNVQKKSLRNYQFLLPLIQISFFRHFPHFLKQISYPVIIQQTIEKGPHEDYLFYRTMKNETIQITNTSVFKFYHLNGAHPPFRLNGSLEYEKLPDNRTGYKEQSKASLKIVAGLLEKLKIAGTYDNSMIIVIGDHGMQSNAYEINTSQKSSANSVSYTSPDVVSGGLPLVLIKPFNSNGSLVVSDAPVSLSDIPKTVASEVAFQNNFPGMSIFKINDSASRNFTYYHYLFTQEYWFADYLPPLHEYTINNFSWFGSSWQPTYTVYSSHGIQKEYPPPYALNSTIKIGKNEETDAFLAVGWSTPADYYAWSVGTTSTVAFTMNKTDSDLVLKMTLFPLRVENVYETQRVFVFCNKHEIGNFTLSKSGESEKIIFIPQTYLNDQIQYISFYLPDAKSPNELGISDDKRKISIGLTSFGLEKINNDRIFFDDKWSPVENWSGTDTLWMNDDASLTIFSKTDYITNLTFNCMSFNRTRALSVYLNNQAIKKENISMTFNSATIPLNIHKGVNQIQLLVDERCDRPVDIPELKSSDDRCLGIAFQDIKITL